MTTTHPLEPMTADDFDEAALLEEALARWAPSAEANCHMCRHMFTSGTPRCTAYPDGIPWEIQSGQVDHRLPYTDDRGIRYDPLTPDEFRTRAATLRAEAAKLRQRGAAD